MSSIEWTDETWNPVTGCTKVSPGCKHCYAERLTERFGRQKFTDIVLHPDRLDKPLHWRKTRRVFVNSMSDLFHEEIPDEFLDRVFAVMACAPSHTFQILTKRAKRMMEYTQALINGKRMLGNASDRNGGGLMDRLLIMSAYGVKVGDGGEPPYRPLPNVWLGVSVEDQKRADERIPLLLQTPAAVRFISAEPLLEQIDITGSPWWDWRYTYKYFKTAYPDAGPPLDWVIVGGESGPGARPCHIDWIRSILRQCRAAGVPCFVKQMGSDPRENTDWWLSDYIKHPKGGDPSEWTEDLRVREYPQPLHLPGAGGHDAIP